MCAIDIGMSHSYTCRSVSGFHNAGRSSITAVCVLAESEHREENFLLGAFCKYRCNLVMDLRHFCAVNDKIKNLLPSENREGSAECVPLP